MPIDREFINSLPSNPLLGENKIIEEFNRILAESQKQNNREKFYNDFLDFYSFYQVYSAKHSLNLRFPPLTNDKRINIGIILNFFEKRQKELEEELDEIIALKNLEDRKSVFESMLKEDILYKLTNNELSEIYKIIDNVIDMVNENFTIRSNLKQRLINLLGILKRELKPEMPNFDRFWSLVGYTGILYGLYEQKTMRIIEKIKELLNIIWKVIAKAEGLPSTSPVLTIIFKELTPK